MDNGLKIAMSPVQLAAVLSDNSVTESETMSNRLLGGLDILMGSLELAGATALCLVPEPTGLTKVGCVVVGAHSMDSINNAANRILSGSNTRTTTYWATSELAKKFGADEDTAWEIGLTVDIAIPIALSLGLGAVRVASVRSGRIRLIEHESVSGPKPGGHTVSQHVGLSEASLRARLANRPTMAATSTFIDLRTAEDAITKAMYANKSLIKQWASNAPGGNKLEIDYFVGKKIGFGIESATGPLINSQKIRVVLQLEKYNGKPYYILTAFPSFR